MTATVQKKKKLLNTSTGGQSKEAVSEGGGYAWILFQPKQENHCEVINGTSSSTAQRDTVREGKR